ncbi:hypothetical protein B0H19DRAFT_1069361 [Mycena capillaripes]|nr:hypothetical protein B0H19DRAFT_1069361 [Mycena capillaripes]
MSTSLGTLTSTRVHNGRWMVDEGSRRALEGKFFDPDSQDVAQHLGYPLYVPNETDALFSLGESEDDAVDTARDEPSAVIDENYMLPGASISHSYFEGHIPSSCQPEYAPQLGQGLGFPSTERHFRGQAEEYAMLLISGRLATSATKRSWVAADSYQRYQWSIALAGSY